jgi:purine-binding chemotaxis protein CheW
MLSRRPPGELLGGGAARAVRRAADGKRTEYLAFALAGESYGVQIAHVAEILKPLPITEVPRAPRNVIGVMSVRGKLVTVMDLRRRLKLPESAMDRRSRILLADAGGGEQIGLLVDEVKQVYRLADEEVEAANVLGADQPPHIAGIGRPAGALLILLDLRPILES